MYVGYFRVDYVSVVAKLFIKESVNRVILLYDGEISGSNFVL